MTDGDRIGGQEQEIDSEPIVPGRVVELTPRLRRITQDNPGPFTGPGTNTFLLGDSADRDAELLLLEPGEEDDAHFEAVVAAVATARVSAVIPSHAHPDHWPLAARFGRHFDAPTYGLDARGGFAPDRRLADGDVLRAGPIELTALHTPGHASDHLCFVTPDTRTNGPASMDCAGQHGLALFSGDHVMGWSTSIIMPPDGHLNDYLASLERLLELPLAVMYPAHGPTVTQPLERIREVLEHRRMRSDQTVAALDGGASTLADLVAAVYPEIPDAMRPAAELSLQAHLEALCEDGLVEVASATEGSGARYRLR